MDKESAWILKQLSMQEIPAVSADRILRALEILRRKEQSQIVGLQVAGEESAAPEITQVMKESITETRDLPSVDVESDESIIQMEMGDEAEAQDVEITGDQEIANAEVVSEIDETYQEMRELASGDTLWPEATSEKLLEDDYTKVIDDISYDMEPTLEEVGDVASMKPASRSSEIEIINRLQDVNIAPQSSLPQRLAKKMLSGSKTMQGQDRFASAMFVHVSDSSGELQNISVDQYADIMADCLSMIIDIIYIKYEGCISRIAGDSILAIFGVPITHEDDAERSIFAALDLLGLLNKLNLNAAIGINTGVIHVDEMNPDFYLECSSWSSDVNLASAFQSNANPGEIWVGMATHRLVDKIFDFDEPVSPESGMAKKQAAYRVLGVSDCSDVIGEIDDLNIGMVGIKQSPKSSQSSYGNYSELRNLELVTGVEDKTIGEIMVSNGLISREQLVAAMKLQESHQKPEGVSVAIGNIAPNDSEMSFELQLAETLVGLGYVNKKDILLGYALKLGADHKILSQISRNSKAREILSLRLVYKYSIVPVNMIGNALVVAAQKHLSNVEVSEIEEKLGRILIVRSIFDV